MSTKRTPLNRDRRQRFDVLPGAVELLETCLRLNDKNANCSKPGNCLEPVNTRCADCEAFFEARTALHRLYARKPWQECIEDVPADGKPPSWMSEERAQSLDFYGAAEIRMALEKARRRGGGH